MLDTPGLQAALLQIQPIAYQRNVFRCVELAALLGDGNKKIQPLMIWVLGGLGNRYV